MGTKSQRAEPAANGSESGAEARPETKRITVDLPRAEHRFLRDAAYDLDTDGMRVVRALLLELRDDEDLRERVAERIAGL